MPAGLVKPLQALMTEFDNHVIQWVFISKGTSLNMSILNCFEIRHF